VAVLVGILAMVVMEVSTAVLALQVVVAVAVAAVVVLMSITPLTIHGVVVAVGALEF
jgi:hypothetical protein